MKVKDLIKNLNLVNPDAYIEIKTDKRWSEDIKQIITIGYGEDADVVLLSSISTTE